MSALAHTYYWLTIAHAWGFDYSDEYGRRWTDGPNVGRRLF